MSVEATVELVNPYTLVSDVQDECRNSNDVGAANKMANAINRASRYIDDYCHTDFLFHDCTTNPLEVQPDWAQGQSIFPPWPILTLTAITFLNPPEPYIVPPINYMVWTQGYFPEIQMAEAWGKFWARVYGEINRVGRLDPVHRIQLTGTFGLPADTTNPGTVPPPTLPYAIRRSCTLIAARWSGEYRKEQIGFGGERVTVVDEKIPEEATKLLQKYRYLFV